MRARAVLAEEALTGKEFPALGAAASTAGQCNPDAVAVLLVILQMRHLFSRQAANRAALFGPLVAPEGFGGELMATLGARVDVVLHFAFSKMEKPPLLARASVW
jgi:hypothetical protein